MNQFTSAVEQLRISFGQQNGCSLIEVFNDGPEPTYNFRIERDRKILEGTLWAATGAQFIVVDLDTGEFLFERDGLPIGSSEYKKSIAAVLELLFPPRSSDGAS